MARGLEIRSCGSFINVPYFYSGGVPQQPQTKCPNCPPNMFGGVGPGTTDNLEKATNNQLLAHNLLIHLQILVTNWRIYLI